MTTSSLPEEQLRQQVRIRLAQGRLPSVRGAYNPHRGTGRPCLVCRREIGPAEVECQVDGPGVVLVAHDACYTIWREESSGMPVEPTCRHCRKPIRPGEPRYREPEGDAHLGCYEARRR